jgi:Flp pilus assembly protein TadB
MSRFTSDDAAYAENWRTILLVDAAIGWALVVIGFVLANAVGLILLGAGAAYLVFGLRRSRRWKRLRAERGLP